MYKMQNKKRSCINRSNGTELSLKSSHLYIDKADDTNLSAPEMIQRIKELEEINAQLEQIANDRSKKLTEVIETNAKFLSIIAHDLRSPFSSIISVLELLKDSYYDHNLEDVKKYIRMATNSANGTLSLLENLLAWTLAENKMTSFNPVKLNVKNLIDEEFENFISAATHKLISLNHSISENLHVSADIDMFKTILRNLISNAIKYSFIGGEVTINATELKQFVEISVEDTGIGITQKDRKELFRRNEIHTTRGTNNESGTGLGLILCKEFVEKHGGTIRIESEPGKGSRILFTLPQSD
jgi:signal transduction histidine kinase